MLGLLKFRSLITIVILLICTAALLNAKLANIFMKDASGFFGVIWKLGRIGQRMSLVISIACIALILI